MILIDEMGNLIHAIIWKNQINRFRERFCEGSPIIIKNFKVIETMSEYRPLSTLFKIIFFRITVVHKLPEESVPIPKNGSQFIQPDMIR
ncbi:hypothetical protein MTR67_026765 [Solanum verrucosum]|uniref:Replication protein A 70 kDa DNA-binding subunit B/D first OB fold domain-containing protein n=1 Tax=Solanum verrucosum TaxID=315347 RepID=A0AAF0R2X1_SOLVR|nr:hypothetical protein MTR67_026765 [Solanum verrucosum]